MIQTQGNDIYRDGQKIGWVSGNNIYDHEGKRLGFFDSDSVYDVNGQRLAHLSGSYVYSGSKEMKLEDVLGAISSTGLSDVACVAITTLL